MEIERKWLISRLPEPKELGWLKPSVGSLNVLQVYQETRYLVATDDLEVRIRRVQVTKDDGTFEIKHLLTLKNNSTLVRNEWEIQLTKQQYEDLLVFSTKQMIVASGVIAQVEGVFVKYNLECVTIDGVWSYAEVEFPSEEDAQKFEFSLPDIVIKEVTEDPDFKMKNYWRRTRGT